MFVNDRRDNWHELLPFIMHAYQTSVHESTGYSPFRLMMGEECSLPQDVSTAELRTQWENDVAPHPFATWVRDALEVAYDHVRSSLKKTASRRKNYTTRRQWIASFRWAHGYYDTTHRPPSINWVHPGSDLIRLLDKPPVIRLEFSETQINLLYLFMWMI